MKTPRENQSMTERPKGTLYNGALPPSIKLVEEGDNFIGEFLGRKQTNIKGNLVWVYSFRNDLGDVCSLLGKFHLDRTWDALEVEFTESLIGRRIYIERMRSVEVQSSGRLMAEYDVILVKEDIA